jgi:phosphoribosylamine--glycine ligase
VVVAQDDPLALGMVDALGRRASPASAPDGRRPHRGSKVFSKDLMKKYGIPTADYRGL